MVLVWKFQHGSNILAWYFEVVGKVLVWYKYGINMILRYLEVIEKGSSVC